MNKKLLLGIGSIVIVICVAVSYVLLQKDAKTEPPALNNPEQVSSPSNATDTIKGKYLDYTEENFASTMGTRLLFFHAPWCPQCRAVDESIKTAELPDGLTVFKIDYDSSQPLRVKYVVTLQTTVVKVDEDGNKVKSYVAYNEPSFQSVQRALLP